MIESFGCLLYSIAFASRARYISSRVQEKDREKRGKTVAREPGDDWSYYFLGLKIKTASLV